MLRDTNIERLSNSWSRRKILKNLFSLSKKYLLGRVKRVTEDRKCRSETVEAKWREERWKERNQVDRERRGKRVGFVRLGAVLMITSGFAITTTLCRILLLANLKRDETQTGWDHRAGSWEREDERYVGEAATVAYILLFSPSFHPVPSSTLPCSLKVEIPKLQDYNVVIQLQASVPPVHKYLAKFPVVKQFLEFAQTCRGYANEG